MANTHDCSSNPSQSPSSTPPPNAFRPEFLKTLEAREDAPLAARWVLSSLLRIPEALARVVDAGSAPVAELIGRRLVDGD
jgi:hypothetical protein